MDAYTSKRQKKISLQQEKKAAKDLGGRTQAASGAARLGGGADVRAEGIRVECKYTEGAQYSLKYSDLNKLRKQAVRTLEEPVMQIWFKNGLLDSKYAITRYGHFVENENSTILVTEGKSITLHLNNIASIITSGRSVFILFTKCDPVTVFELVSWDAYLESRANVSS